MIEIAKSNQTEREVLFGNAAKKAGITNPAIIEKDFWVCFTLDWIFHKSLWADRFIFKGGTSLSKAYHIIERFSEDIDLIMDWRLLGYANSTLWEERSRNQQDKFNKKVVDETSDFLTNTFAPEMKKDMRSLLGTEVDVSMDKDDSDQCTVNFYYPRVFNTDYIRQEIRLEIEPLAEWTPSHPVEIKSILAEQYPNAVRQSGIEVPTIDAERTFWKKATILHKTASPFERGKKIPERYSRHYYDLYSMSKTDIKERAFNNSELLKRDIKFKMKFYYAKNASYETAKIGSMKLVPSENAMKILEEDYGHMEEMIYGEKPDFKTIIAGLSVLENEINSL